MNEPKHQYFGSQVKGSKTYRDVLHVAWPLDLHHSPLSGAPLAKTLRWQKFHLRKELQKIMLTENKNSMFQHVFLHMCHLHFWTSMTCKDVPFSIEFNQRVVDVPLLGQLLESRGDYYHDNLLVYFSERGLLVWNIFGIFDALLSSDFFNLWIYCTTILEILKDLESCLSFNSIMMYHSNWCTSKCFRTAHDIYTHLFIYTSLH